MKQNISIILVVVMTFCCLFGCSKSSDITADVKQTMPQVNTYKAIKKIDPCVVEPDDSLVMTDDDKKYYRILMEALLNRKESVTLSDNRQSNLYYIDLLKQSPYYFFAESCTLNGNTAEFVFAYSSQEQEQMQKLIDDKFLEIVNSNASENDNELDIILKIYSAVSSSMNYDSERHDNKRLGSQLFYYPEDEIYEGFKNKKCLCQAFAYTLRFALLQRGIDCFCVYGKCTDREDAHMWNIFRYNGKFYTCDSTWDRKNEDKSPKLYHFGKTEKERIADNLTMVDYSSQYFDEYGKIECVDETFKIFRSIGFYEYIDEHTYRLKDWDGKEYTFDSQTLKIK